MASLPVRTLFDVPGLKPLEAVCKEYQLELTAAGSIVRRLAMLLHRGGKLDDNTLFDLTGHLSDFDLVHSGPAELTPQILNSIQTSVPFAECFRWELRSVVEDTV